MTAKEYLKSYRMLNYSISNLQTLLDETIAEAGNISSPLGREVEGSGSSGEATFVRRVERELALRDILDRELARRIDRKTDIVGKLSTLSHTADAAPTAKYLCGRPVDVIAEEWGYTPRQVWRILDDALSEFIEQYGDDF